MTKRFRDTQAVEHAAAKRSYLSQTEVPAHSLTEALRIARAIADSYGKSPTRPLRVAQALNMLPGSSTFRMLCGASIAYGLTEGGYNSGQISITPLGRRIVAPTADGDDLGASREALLRPRVIGEFLSRYNGSKLPSEQIARNVLEELGVPGERTADVFALIRNDADAVRFLREVKGQTYVDLEGVPAPGPRDSASGEKTAHHELEVGTRREVPSGEDGGELLVAPRKRDRVFITHGRNKEIVGQLKELLTFGGFTAVVAIEQVSTSKPVPDKVMDDMRSCDAAVIHVGTEEQLLDAVGNPRRMLNENVLIEIGAAMALYGSKFILLVERGVTLPSNLQGLYEVRYEGDRLDYESTMRMLKAFNDFRS